MRDWQELRIGEHINFLSGFPFSSDYFGSEDGIPLVRIRDLATSTIETRYAGPYDPRWVVKAGDILIGMDGDFSIVRWRNSDALLNQRVLKADEKPGGRIDRSFFFYWCAPELARIHARTAATTVKHLSVRDLDKATDLFPSLREQQRIAEILSTVDEAIGQTEALIAKTQQIKVGLMHDFFTRGVTPDGKLRPPREEAPQLYKESALGWIPKEWEVSSLGAMSDIVSGVTLNGESPGGIEVPYLRVANVQDGYLDLKEVKTVRVNNTQLAKLALRRGDVLMNEGGDFDKLGRGTVWNEEIVPCIHQNHVFRVRPRLDVLRPRFLAYWSQSEFGKKYFVLSSKQSTNLASINSTQLHRFPVGKPGTFEQDAIEARLAACDLQISALQADLEKFRCLHAGLMQDLLSGRMRVDADALRERKVASTNV